MDTEIGLYLLLIGCVLVGWASSAATASPAPVPGAAARAAEILPGRETDVVRVLTVTRERRLILCFERPQGDCDVWHLAQLEPAPGRHLG